MRREISLKDLARLAGITPPAASRALRDAADISRKRKALVRSLAAKHGYRPNEIARSLRLRKTGTIGLHFTHLDNPFFGRMSHEVQLRLEKAGYSVLLTPTNVPLRESVAFLQRRYVEGMIVSSFQAKKEDIILWRKSRSEVPFAVFGNIDRAAIDSVTTDHAAGVQAAIERLVALGHKTFGYVPFPSGSKNNGRPPPRFSGFRQALAEAAIEIRTEWLVPGTGTMDGAYQAASAFFREKRIPTALFCHNDLCAMGVLRAAHEYGMNVPGDLSIIGFDNIEMSAFTYPPLTTIEQPTEDIAEKLVNLLFQRMKEPFKNSEQILVQPRLVVRESIGAPARN